MKLLLLKRDTSRYFLCADIDQLTGLGRLIYVGGLPARHIFTHEAYKDNVKPAIILRKWKEELQSACAPDKAASGWPGAYPAEFRERFRGLHDAGKPE